MRHLFIAPLIQNPIQLFWNEISSLLFVDGLSTCRKVTVLALHWDVIIA